MTTILNIFYRPPENHVGVIYRFGRFGRFADPDRWTVVPIALEQIVKEISLDIRTANIALGNVLTRDNVALDLELKVFYAVDVRKADPDRTIQVLRFESESAWEEIVKTGINDIARNVVVISRSFDEIMTPDGRASLRQGLSAELAARVPGFGILVNSRFGVNIMNLQPNETFQQALLEVSAAKALGSAAAERIRPILEQFEDQKQQKALLSLVMQIAAAIAKSGQSPDILLPNLDEFLANQKVQASGNIEGRLAGDPSTDAPPPPQKPQPGVA